MAIWARYFPTAGGTILTFSAAWALRIIQLWHCNATDNAAISYKTGSATKFTRLKREAQPEA
jgi:hypothetical protein